jgi:hypothetical protein
MAKVIVIAALALAIGASTIAELTTYAEFAVVDSCGGGDC